MKQSLSLVSPLLATLLHAAAVDKSVASLGALVSRDGTEDLLYSQLLEDGLCHYYLNNPEDETHEMFTPSNDRLQNEVCNEWCEGETGKAAGMCSVWELDDMFDGEIGEACGGLDKINKQCVDEVFPDVLHEVVPYLDGETNAWFIYSRCDCTAGEVVETIFVDIILPMLVELGEFLTEAVNTFIDVMIEVATIAVSFVPGGAFVGSAARIVRAAKTMAENALDGAAFFNDYLRGEDSPSIGDIGLIKVPDNPDEVFEQLIQAPDVLNGVDMSSLGCRKKNKSDCRKMEDRGEKNIPEKNDDDDNNTTTKTTTSDTSTTSSTTSTTETTDSTTTTADPTTTTTDTTSTTTSSTATCTGSGARETGAAGDSCEEGPAECSGNNTMLCEDKDCKGNSDTLRCTTSGKTSCKCLLEADAGPAFPYTMAQINAQYALLNNAWTKEPPAGNSTEAVERRLLHDMFEGHKRAAPALRRHR